MCFCVQAFRRFRPTHKSTPPSTVQCSLGRQSPLAVRYASAVQGADGEPQSYTTRMCCIRINHQINPGRRDRIFSLRSLSSIPGADRCCRVTYFHIFFCLVVTAVAAVWLWLLLFAGCWLLHLSGLSPDGIQYASASSPPPNLNQLAYTMNFHFSFR